MQLGPGTAHARQSIDAVLLDQGYATGYGNALTLAYRPRVLFSDGTYTTDAAGALGSAPRIDGQWRRDGSAFVLNARDGKTRRIEARMRARPAERGATLEGEYRSLAGAGSALMNVPVVAAAKTLRFAKDGTLVTDKSAGASTGSVATASRSTGGARYALDGYTIAISGADGRSETRLFYFFPDSDRVIGVGGGTLSARR
jgi:hypothetical protein